MTVSAWRHIVEVGLMFLILCFSILVAAGVFILTTKIIGALGAIWT